MKKLHAKQPGPGTIAAILAIAGSNPRSAGRPPFLRMYQRIYLAVVGALVLTVVLTACVWRYIEAHRQDLPFKTLAEVVYDSLPPASAERKMQANVVDYWAARVGALVALYDGEGRLIAAAGREILPLPPSTQTGSGMVDDSDDRYAKLLDDGRWLVVEIIGNDQARRWTIIGALILVALGTGIAVYPVVRRITGRLEELQSSVEALGDGNLGTRVNFTGSDEVAVLAASFNRSAVRIEALVGAQKALLANASHELRSPLARIQMALSLVGSSADRSAREEINTSIRELDHLIGEILLASRFESGNSQAVLKIRQIDLTGLVAEEAARVHADLQGAHIHVQGDPTLLRRLIRNLLENAQRYGRDSPIKVMLECDNDMAIIQVCDGGPGIPEQEREKVFDPFYRLKGSSEQHGGVGLGLSLVMNIARQHGGDVQCVSREEGGACFRVRLPVCSEVL